MGEMRRALARWNLRWQDTPRRLLITLLAVGGAALALRLLPYVGPFVLALLFAWMLRPLVRQLRRAFARLRFGRGLATLLAMALLFGAVGFAVGALARRLWQEVLALVRLAPETIRTWMTQTMAWLEGWEQGSDFALPSPVAELLTSLLTTLGKQLLNAASSLSAALASGAVTTAANLPRTLLAVVLTVMSTYSFSSDGARIAAFVRRHLPEHALDWVGRVRQGALHALGRQLRAQLLVSLVVTVVVILGLALLQRPYALALGLMIGVADALPVIGAGLFLLPWGVWGLATGDSLIGWGMLLLYGAVVLTRQIAEPRIVGKSLGLHPLATMMSMYIGLQTLGFAGLLLGPLLLTLCRAVLAEVPLPRGAAEDGPRPMMKYP